MLIFHFLKNIFKVDSQSELDKTKPLDFNWLDLQIQPSVTEKKNCNNLSLDKTFSIYNQFWNS